MIRVLEKLPLQERKKAGKITLIMAKKHRISNQNNLPRKHFGYDRFHVLKIVAEALQHFRIQLRWKERKIKKIVPP